MPNNMRPNHEPNILVDHLCVAWRNARADEQPDLRLFVSRAPGISIEISETLVRVDVSERSLRKLSVELGYYIEAVGRANIPPGSRAALLVLNQQRAGGLDRAEASRRYGPEYDSDIEAIWSFASEADEPRQSGKSISGYRLFERIDDPQANSWGEVWHAVREHPHQHVAIKFFPPERIRKDLLKRFTEVEPRVLARMNHPNVARFLELGEADGTPYLVMEYVRDALDLRLYCDHHRLTIRQRLALMIQVCEAVQYIHQKGIVHRDLKPGNILVSDPGNGPPEKAIPKLIDFGLAKSVDDDNPIASAVTSQAGQFMGSMAYSSEEHLGGRATQKSDIYSLGAILFELLVGRTPMQRVLEDDELSGVRKEAELRESPRPTVLRVFNQLSPSQQTIIAKQRSTSVHELRRLLGSRLSYLPSQALQSPKDRFEYAVYFADDIGNYLLDANYEHCRREFKLDRARRAVRRHKGQFIAAGAVFLTLVTGLIGTTWQWQRAEQSEARILATARSLVGEADDLDPVMWAVASGDDEGLSAKISSGYDVDQVNWRGDTALMLAVRVGDARATKILLDAGADVYALTFSRSSPDPLAHLSGWGRYERWPVLGAIRGGSADCLRLVLSAMSEQGLPPTDGPAHSWTSAWGSGFGGGVLAEAYRLAIQSDRIDMLELILHADVYVSESHRNDVVRFAAEHAVARGSKSAFELIQNDRNYPKDDFWLLYTAAANGQEAMFVSLLAGGQRLEQVVSEDSSAEFLVEQAITGGSVPVLATVLDEYEARDLIGIGTPETRWRLVATAATKGSRNPSSETLELLLSRWKIRPGYIDTRTGRSPLHEAAGALGTIRAVQVLLERGFSPDEQDLEGLTPMHEAAKTGSVDVYSLLAEHSNAPAAQDAAGNTVLHYVIDSRPDVVQSLRSDEESQLPLFRLIVALNPTLVNVRNHAGNRPIDVAMQRGCDRMRDLLLENGAKLLSPETGHDSSRLTLSAVLGCYGARAGRDVDSLELLDQRGAISFELNSFGYTALHAAARYERLAAMAWLIQHGHPVDEVDVNGHTPLHYAADSGSMSGIKLLLDNRANPLLKNAAGQTPADISGLNGHTEASELLQNAQN